MTNFLIIDRDLLNARGIERAKCITCIQEGFLTQYVDIPTGERIILDLVLRHEPGQVREEMSRSWVDREQLLFDVHI